MSARIAHALDRLATLREDPRTPILLVIAGGWSLSLGVRLVYPAVIPHLRTAYGISLSTAGLLLTVLWLAYAIGQLPGGILADRLGERRVLVASTFISGATLGLVVVAGAVEVLFAATVLFGLSTALYGVARFTILTEVYPDNDGTAIGVTMAAGDLGNAVLPPFAGFLAVTFAWQFGFAFAVPLFLLAGVGLFVALPRSDRQRAMASSDDAPEEPWLTRTAATVRRVASALRSRPVAVVTAIQTLGYCAWQALTGFYPTYLIDVKGFAPTTATLLFGGFFALGVVVKPLAGRAYDASGIRTTLPVILGVAGVGLVLLPFVDSLPGILLVTLLLSSILGYSTVTLTHLTASLPAAVRGSGLGVLRTGYMVIGAGSPVVAGLLADADLFDEVFFILAALVAVGACLTVLLSEG